MAGSDYGQVTEVLVIPPCEEKLCQNISTYEDNKVERFETFYVMLSHGANGDVDNRIIIPTPIKQFEIHSQSSKLPNYI